jgi:hypothetical protein
VSPAINRPNGQKLADMPDEKFEEALAEQENATLSNLCQGAASGR